MAVEIARPGRKRFENVGAVDGAEVEDGIRPRSLILSTKNRQSRRTRLGPSWSMLPSVGGTHLIFVKTTPCKVPLRLQPSLLEEARKLAELEGVALNQLINVAVAEKLSALRTDDYFSQRAARANLPNLPERVLAPQRRLDSIGPVLRG
jgi:hypothetical protein